MMPNLDVSEGFLKKGGGSKGSFLGKLMIDEPNAQPIPGCKLLRSQK